MKRFTCLLVFLALVGPAVFVEAQTGDPVALEQALNSRIRLTAVTADRSDIVTPGDVVQINKAGLVMYSVASPLPPSNTYKNGKIGQGWSGFGKDLMIGVATPGDATAASYPHRQFVAGEKCWVSGLQVQKDGIQVRLYSDPYDNIHYYANLKIPFPNRKEVPSIDTALHLLMEVLTVLPQDSTDVAQAPVVAGTNGATAQFVAISGQYATQSLSGNSPRLILYADGTFTKSVGNGQGQGQFTMDGSALTMIFSSGHVQNLIVQCGGLYDSISRVTYLRTGEAPSREAQVETDTSPQAVSPTAAAMQEIAPPPPPSDAVAPAAQSTISSASPQTINLGQTMNQVTAMLGDPKSVQRAGGNTIFIYSDLKVTFLDGKVSDVE